MPTTFYNTPDNFLVDESATIDSESLYQRMRREQGRPRAMREQTRRTYRPEWTLSADPARVSRNDYETFNYTVGLDLVARPEPIAPKASNKRYHPISILFNKEKQIRDEV